MDKRSSRFRPTVRRMMVAVAVVGLSLGIIDQLRMGARSARYRRKAQACERMIRRCREIEAMDPATRAREAAAAFDNPYLDDPAWNRQMIPYFELLRKKYEYAAAHPRTPLPPDPPNP
jgi:hypothetical protein